MVCLRNICINTLQKGAKMMMTMMMMMKIKIIIIIINSGGTGI
jgi:hypothetical protein